MTAADTATPVYGSDPYAYNLRAALEAARERVRARRRRPKQKEKK